MPLKKILQIYWIDICRIFLISNIFYHLIQIDVKSLSLYPSFFKESLFFFQFIPYQSINFYILKYSLLLCLVFLIPGYKMHLVSVLSFVLAFLIFGYRYNFGIFHWADSIIPLSLLMLAIFPVSNFRSKRFLPGSHPADLNSYHIFSMKFILVYMFFSAGISKLQHSGLHWFSSDNMKTLFLINKNMFSGWFPETDSLLYLFIINNDLILSVGGIVVLFMELISPIALFPNRCKAFTVCGLLALLVAFKIILRHDFLSYCWPLFFYFFVFEPEKKFPLDALKNNCIKAFKKLLAIRLNLLLYFKKLE